MVTEEFSSFRSGELTAVCSIPPSIRSCFRFEPPPTHLPQIKVPFLSSRCQSRPVKHASSNPVIRALGSPAKASFVTLMNINWREGEITLKISGVTSCGMLKAETEKGDKLGVTVHQCAKIIAHQDELNKPWASGDEWYRWLWSQRETLTQVSYKSSFRADMLKACCVLCLLEYIIYTDPDTQWGNKLVTHLNLT